MNPSTRSWPSTWPSSTGAEASGEGGADVSLREIVADIEQRHAVHLCAGIGEAVAQVQARRVAALAVAGMGRNGDADFCKAEGGHPDTDRLAEAVHESLGGLRRQRPNASHRQD